MSSTRPGGWNGGVKGGERIWTGLFVDLPHRSSLSEFVEEESIVFVVTCVPTPPILHCLMQNIVKLYPKRKRKH
jgi:hypothetical protein